MITKPSSIVKEVMLQYLSEELEKVGVPNYIRFIMYDPGYIILQDGKGVSLATLFVNDDAVVMAAEAYASPTRRCRGIKLQISIADLHTTPPEVIVMRVKRAVESCLNLNKAVQDLITGIKV